MTTIELRQYIKSTALNKIAFIHSKYWVVDQYDRENSYAEQRDMEVRNIVSQMERDLAAVKSGAYTKNI
jgi:hypothetical protein